MGGVERGGSQRVAPQEAAAGIQVLSSAESGRIEAIAARARGGGLWTVLIEGGPASGKSELLRQICAALPGTARLTARCVAEKSRLAFGVLDRLVRTAEIPLSALHGQDGTPEQLLNPHNAGLRLAAQLRAGSNAGPVVFALDDAQWIDSASAAAVRVAVRRLENPGVLLIATTRLRWSRAHNVRPEIDAFFDVFLRRERSYRIIAVGDHTDRPDGAQREQSTDEAGNPDGLDADDGDRAGRPDRIGGSDADGRPTSSGAALGSMYASVLRRTTSLPEPALRLIAALAVANEHLPLPVLGSIAGVDDPSGALDHVVDAGFVKWFPEEPAEPVGIRSQMLRDVLYYNLTPSLRNEMHLAVAERMGGVEGWGHRIVGARRHDRVLCADLEAESARYHTAGDVERAGTLLLWAADAAPERDERERLLLTAARWYLGTPTVGWADRLVPRLAGLEPSPARNLVLGLQAAREGRYRTTYSLLQHAHTLAAPDGETASPDDPSLRVEIDLALATLHADTGDAVAQDLVAQRLLADPGLSDVTRAWATYFAGDARGRISGGATASLSMLDTLVPDPAAYDDGARPGRRVLLWARGLWRAQTCRLTDARYDLEQVLGCIDDPVESVLPLTHAYLGYVMFMLGDWRCAEESAFWALRLADEQGDARHGIPAEALNACISALRGTWGTATQRLGAAVARHRRLGPSSHAVFPAIAAATLAQARGDPARMVTALQGLAARPQLAAGHQAWWRPLQIEGLIRTDRLADARDAFRAYRESADGDPRPTVAADWLDALLAAAEGRAFDAETRFVRALERPATDDDAPFHRARLEHDYGRLLLSSRRRRSAIRWLIQARDRFEALGAVPFAQRCARDLGAAGVQTPDAVPGSVPGAGNASAGLTAQEERIARMAAQGMTNQEVARALFISSKTVEYHLGNAFAKLGIISRRNLRSALDALAADHGATPS